MSIVASYDWERDEFTHHSQEHQARQAWRRAVVTSGVRPGPRLGRVVQEDARMGDTMQRGCSHPQDTPLTPPATPLPRPL